MEKARVLRGLRAAAWPLAFCAGLWLMRGSCTSDVNEKINDVYLYRDEGGDMVQLLSVSGEKFSTNIYGKVYRYEYDDDFLVAAQHPSRTDYRQMLAFDLRDDRRRYPVDDDAARVRSEAAADSILGADAFYRSVFAHPTNYWIVAFREKKVYGPLTRAQYARTMAAQRVPAGLDVAEE